MTELEKKSMMKIAYKNIEIVSAFLKNKILDTISKWFHLAKKNDQFFSSGIPLRILNNLGQVMTTVVRWNKTNSVIFSGFFFSILLI